MTDTEHRYKIVVFKHIDKKYTSPIAFFYSDDLSDLVDRVKEYTEISKLYEIRVRKDF